MRKGVAVMIITRTEARAAAQRYMLISGAGLAVSVFYSYVSYSVGFDDMLGVFMAPLLLGFLPLRVLADINRMYLPDRRTLALHSTAVALFMLGSVLFATTGRFQTGRQLTSLLGWTGTLLLLLTVLSYFFRRTALLKNRDKA